MPIAGDGVAQVMGRYQDVMQHFLELQRSVMLAYLGGDRRAGAPAAPPPARTARQPAPPAPAPTVPEAAATAPVPAVVPAAAPAPSTNGGGNGHATLTRIEIREHLLAVVSERTGYPADMLALDADLEGDLGIDSIKRVEIAGTLTQTLLQGVIVDVEQLTASRTLDEVITTLGSACAGDGAATEASPFEPGPAEEERIGRFVLQAVSAPPITATAGLAAAGAVVIVDDEAGTGQALAGELTRQGETVVMISPADAPEDAAGAARVAEQLRAGTGARPRRSCTSRDARLPRCSLLLCAGLRARPRGGGRRGRRRRCWPRAGWTGPSACRTAFPRAPPPRARPPASPSRWRASGPRCGSRWSTWARRRRRPRPSTCSPSCAPPTTSSRSATATATGPPCRSCRRRWTIVPTATRSTATPCSWSPAAPAGSRR